MKTLLIILILSVSGFCAMASVPAKLHYWDGSQWVPWNVSTTFTDSLFGSKDDVTGANIYVEQEHHEIHEGRHFFVCGFDTLGSGDTLVFSVSVPDTSRRVHMTFSITGISETQVYIYDSSVLGSGGAEVTPFNSDRGSTKVSVATVKINPVVSSYGALIYSQSKGRAGATPNAADGEGITERGHEIILRKNSVTLFKVVSKDASNIVSYCGNWYEQTPVRNP